MKLGIIVLIICGSLQSFSQTKISFDGQLSAISSYSPSNNLEAFCGARYLPSLSIGSPLDSNQLLDFEFSANVSASTLFHPFDSSNTNFNLSPYRLWARYSARQLELRVGLQKIDFGSASLIRPLQWFNQIDPRDPLQLTNGVYGVLGRYTFLNNANMWVWGLYGNDKQRGFDLLPSVDNIPEVGGRVQVPFEFGEVALSYNHRNVFNNDSIGIPIFENSSENKYGFDVRLDKVVGFWIESSYSQKEQNIGLFTNQLLVNVGMDYTFAVGNGLSIIAEHLTAQFFDPSSVNACTKVTALVASYPIGLFDNISAISFYNWNSENATIFINYEHTFAQFSAYVMAFYNPPNQAGIVQNELINNFSGPGLRFMVVYNH